MVFKASLDSFTNITTAVISFILAGILFLPIVFKSENILNYPYILLFIILPIYFFSFAFRPIKYEITDGKVIINRMLANIKISFSDIKEIHQINNLSIFSTVRIFASGGFFGYFGIFWNLKYGRMNFYATRRNNALMIISNENVKFVITPNEPNVFLEYFLKLNSSKTINIASE